MEYRIITVRTANRLTGVTEDRTNVAMTEQPIHWRSETSLVYATFRASTGEPRTSVRFHVKQSNDHGGYVDREVETKDLVLAARSGGMYLVQFLQQEYKAATGEVL